MACNNCPSSIGPQGEPVRHMCGNPCDPCGTCKKPSCGGCGPVKQISRIAGISTAVVDDASELTYFYGNILHENYHVPAEECQPYVVVPTNWETYKTLKPKTETFEGEQAGDTVVLEFEPCEARHMFVFLNGLHQDEGADFDYQRTGKSIKFNFHSLVSTDRVTIKYNYVKVGA